MGEREPELGCEELLDVRAAGVLGFLNLDDTEDLEKAMSPGDTNDETANIHGWT